MIPDAPEWMPAILVRDLAVMSRVKGSSNGKNNLTLMRRQ